MDSASKESPSFHSLCLSSSSLCKLITWKVSPGDRVRNGTPLATYTSNLSQDEQSPAAMQLKSNIVGVVKELLCDSSDIIQPDTTVVVIEKKCDHSIVVFDMCADCGLNLRSTQSNRGTSEPVAASVRIIHGIPEIRISQKEAEVLGNKDKLRLLQHRKLALVVDLDQTLVHTSMDHNIERGLPDVYGFHLPGHSPLYHCRLRPYIHQFLLKVSKLYEMHVFTMGTKSYAACVTRILDPEKKLFCDRIISRDEFFDPYSKALRLKSVFPCGDAMVAIIDDREDVWGRCPNLIHVKPYLFFAGTSDINAPPSRPSSTQSAQEPSSPPEQRTPFKTHRQPSSTKPSSVTETTRTINTSNTTQQHPGNKKEAENHQENDPVLIRCTSTEEDSSEKTNEAVSEADTTLAPPPPPPPPDQETTSGVTDKTEEEETVISSGVNDKSAGNDKGGVNDKGAVIDEGQGEEVKPTADVNGSSSSSSDSDDSSSSSSSGIDDALFEDFGEEEKTNNTAQDETVNNGQAEAATSSSSDTLLEKDVPTEQRDVSGVGVEQEVKMEVEETEKHVKVNKEEKADAKQPTDESTQSGENTMEVVSPETDNTTVHHTDLEELLLKPSVGTGENSQESQAEVKQREIIDPDDFLLHLGEILDRLHSTFYSEYNKMTEGMTLTVAADIPTPDLKELIPTMRRSVLKGTNILFTGVIPTNMPREKSPEWNTARAFGATVHDTLVPGLDSSNRKRVSRATTHVIAGKSGTTKFHEARKMPGVKIVNPDWLWACAIQWKRLDESQFGFPLIERGDDRETRRASGDGKPRRKVSRIEEQHLKEDVPQMSEVAPASYESNHKVEGVMNSRLPGGEAHDDSAFSDSIMIEGTEFKSRFNQFKRLESRLSVSDEELERMDAEVDAEISNSSSSSSESDVDELGSFIEKRDEDDSLSYERFAGTELSERASRKRRHAEVENSSSSNSPTPNSFDVLNDPSDEDGEAVSNGDDESGDELAALLA